MARHISRLSPRKVATETKPGRHADGGGLYLVVDRSGAKRWAFLFRWQKKLKEMGLGGVNAVPLAKARELAAGCRAQLAAGFNPIATRRTPKAEIPTFGTFADAFVATKAVEWRNAKHQYQWRMTLTTYAKPLRAKPVNEITTEDVLATLKPLWTTKSETASRLRGRIEAVLDAARVVGHRTGENPARWRGHLDKLLPRPRKLSRGHHAAMPYSEVPTFIAGLRERDAVAARALEFIILTGARSGEVLGMTWAELDLGARLWVVPGARMKVGREHRVPLTNQALKVIEKVAPLTESNNSDSNVFPGHRRGRPLSNTATEMLLRRMRANVTTHGFRSSFRDWAGDRTHFAREVAEAALAHTVGDETERAYRRGDALAKRRELMQAWADYLDSAQQNQVMSLKRA
jgi:integrase